MAPRNHKELFNLRHSSLRSAAAECGFGLLKGKWRRLQSSTVAKISVMRSILCAACSVHNYVINSGRVLAGVDVLSATELKALSADLDFNIDFSAPEWQFDLDGFDDGFDAAIPAQPDVTGNDADQDGDQDLFQDPSYGLSSSQLRDDIARHGFDQYKQWRQRLATDASLRGTALGAQVAQLATIHEQSVAITNPSPL